MSPRVKSARLRETVDDGDADSEVHAPDPAAAALGSDADNAEKPTAPDSLEAAYHDEVEKSLARTEQNQPGRGSTLIMLIVTAIIGVVVGFLAVMLI